MTDLQIVVALFVALQIGIVVGIAIAHALHKQANPRCPGLFGDEGDR